MAVTLNANTSTGFIATSDTSGVLQLQTGGTTAVTVDASQRTAFVAGTAALPAITTTGDTNTGIFFPAADTIAFSEGGVEAARFDSSGRLGIGTTSPASQLHIYPSTANVFTEGLRVNREGQTGQYAIVNYSNGVGRFVAVDSLFNSPSIGFFTSSDGSTQTERARIDSSGNLLVGTTSAPDTNFLSKSNFIGLQTTNPADSTKWRQMVFANNSADATLYFPNGSNTATLSSAGAWTNASDGRQKTNIIDINYGLDTVLASQPHSYNRTDVEGDYLGFVAQELKTLIPEVVFGSEETSYSVDYGSLVAVAFKAIQEQQAIITSLTDRITALEGTTP